MAHPETFLLIWAIVAIVASVATVVFLYLFLCLMTSWNELETKKARALEAERERDEVKATQDSMKITTDLLKDYNKCADARIQSLCVRALSANSHLQDLVTLASRPLPRAEPEEAGGDADG